MHISRSLFWSIALNMSNSAVADIQRSAFGNSPTLKDAHSKPATWGRPLAMLNTPSNTVTLPLASSGPDMCQPVAMRPATSIKLNTPSDGGELNGLRSETSHNSGRFQYALGAWETSAARDAKHASDATTRRSGVIYPEHQSPSNLLGHSRNYPKRSNRQRVLDFSCQDSPTRRRFRWCGRRRLETISPPGGSTMTFTGTPSRSATVGGIPIIQQAVAKVSSGVPPLVSDRPSDRRHGECAARWPPRGCDGCAGHPGRGCGPLRRDRR